MPLTPENNSENRNTLLATMIRTMVMMLTDEVSLQSESGLQ